jgi:epoxyqueuosine reductase
MSLSSADMGVFKRNPAGFIEKAIKDYVANSPGNRFTAFPGEPIWDEPLVGFADGNDPIFNEYKSIIGDYHLTPREALELYIEATNWDSPKDMEKISVISFILPSTEQTRLSNRKETDMVSLRWNHTRWQGHEFLKRLTRYLVSLIEGMGYYATAPEMEKWFSTMKLPNGQSSKWSQRHIAYAAGLGTFSLNDGFITPKGIAVRIGSIVCNLSIPPTPRPYSNHLSNCLFYNGGKCRRCIDRCPAGAITENGHDKVLCESYLTGFLETLKKSGKEGYMGRPVLGCGLCQTKVPCEGSIPIAD